MSDGQQHGADPAAGEPKGSGGVPKYFGTTMATTAIAMTAIRMS